MVPLFTLLLFILLFAGLAIFLWIWKRHSKGRVALATISSMAALFFVFSTTISINPIVLVGALLAGASIAEAVAQAQPNTIHIIVVGLVCAFIAFYIYRAGTKMVSSCDGPITQSVADLYDSGQQDRVLAIAVKELEYLYSRRPNPIVATGGAPPLQLADPPSDRPWRLMAVDLLKLDNRDIEVSEQGWSDTAKAWIGRRVEPLSGASKHVLIFADVVRPEASEVTGRIADLTDRDPAAATEVEVIVCVDEDSDYDSKEIRDSGIVVRYISRGHLLLSSLDFGEYCRNLLRRFERDSVPGTSFALQDCYYPLKLYAAVESPGGAQTEKGDAVDFDGAIDVWLARSDRQHLVIAGEYGQGKSTALLAMCARWARQYLENPIVPQQRIPLLIELRGRSPSRQGPAELLNEWGMRFDLKGEALLNLVRAGRAVVIFEGFDEVQDAGRLYDRFRHFDRLWQFAFPTAKVIFTGRPNFFVTDPEMRRLLRIDEAAGAAGRAYTKRYDLAFLEKPQEIAEILRAFPRAVREEIVDTYREDERFAEIASRPSMLPIIGSQWERLKSEREKLGELTTGQIIKYFIDFLYQRKEAEIERDSVERGIAREDNFMLMPKIMKHYFTLGIVRKMVASDARNTISRAEFHRTIEMLWDDFSAVFRSGYFANDYEVTARKLNKRFKDFSRTEIIDAVATDVRANGIFVSDPAAGEGNLCLPHKQYYECLIAEGMKDSLSAPAEPMARAWERCSKLNARSWRPLRIERQALFHFADIVDPKWLKKYFLFLRRTHGEQMIIEVACRICLVFIVVLFSSFVISMQLSKKLRRGFLKEPQIQDAIKSPKYIAFDFRVMELFLLFSSRSNFLVVNFLLTFIILLILLTFGELELASLLILFFALAMISLFPFANTRVLDRYALWSICCIHRFSSIDVVREEFGSLMTKFILFEVVHYSWLSRRARSVVEAELDR